MAKHHGNTTFVSVNGVDISRHCAQCTFGLTVDSHDVTTFGASGAHEYHAGLQDATLSLEGPYETVAVSAAPHNVFMTIRDDTTAVPWIYRPQGTGSGLPIVSGSAFLTNYELSSPATDMGTWTAELQVTGPVVTGTQ